MTPAPNHTDVIVWRADEVDEIEAQATASAGMVLRVEWGSEAFADPYRRSADAGDGVYMVVGFSPSTPGGTRGQRGRLLRVWVVPHPVDGWLGTGLDVTRHNDDRAYYTQGRS